jgi:hypothetical protein
MTKYVTINGDEYVVDSIGELVSAMHDNSYAHAPSDSQFMREMAERVKFSTSSEVRSDTCENFVSDLMSIGYLKEDKDYEGEEIEIGLKD